MPSRIYLWIGSLENCVLMIEDTLKSGFTKYFHINYCLLFSLYWQLNMFQYHFQISYASHNVKITSHISHACPFQLSYGFIDARLLQLKSHRSQIRRVCHVNFNCMIECFLSLMANEKKIAVVGIKKCSNSICKMRWVIFT